MSQDLQFKLDYIVKSILEKARELEMDERDLEVTCEGEVVVSMVCMVIEDMVRMFQCSEDHVKKLEAKIKVMVEASEAMLDAGNGYPCEGKVLRARRQLAESLLGYSSKVPMPEELEKNEHGDLMPYEDWVECVDCSGFIDYDGHGYYATEDGHDKRLVLLPSHYKKGVNPKPDWATHVIWFNR